MSLGCMCAQCSNLALTPKCQRNTIIHRVVIATFLHHYPQHTVHLSQYTRVHHRPLEIVQG